MSFDLRIKINGLCLLVPQEAEGGDPGSARLHVLLPNVEHHHGGGPTDSPPGGGSEHDHSGHGPGDGGNPAPAPSAPHAMIVKHLPRLIYDRAHEQAGSTEFRRDLACRDIEDGILEIPGPATDAIDLFLPGEIADIHKFAGAQGVPRRFVEAEAPGAELAARLTLGAGCVTDYVLGVQVAPPEVESGDGEGDDEEPTAGDAGKKAWGRMTATVEWTIRGIEGDSLVIGIAGLNGKPAKAPVTLHPIRRTIHLEIWNVPEHELPGAPKGKNASGAEHFAGFYDLAPSSTRRVPMPLTLQEPLRSDCFPTPSPQGEPIVSGTLMCMIGQARLA